MSLLKKEVKTKTVYEWMCRQVGKLIDSSAMDAAKPSRLIRIPVCYDLALAPDLVSLAAEHKLDTEEVVKLHTGKTYRVFMIGFLPGFAYMGSVDEKIATPRKINPRTLVPAGSVGIAGEQTGVYPFDSPGGWQLIGQTPIKMFSATKAEPCLLQPGDDVQFYAVTIMEFEKIKTDVAPNL
jgi:inhibitor of KinA